MTPSTCGPRRPCPHGIGGWTSPAIWGLQSRPGACTPRSQHSWSGDPPSKGSPKNRGSRSTRPAASSVSAAPTPVGFESVWQFQVTSRTEQPEQQPPSQRSPAGPTSLRHQGGQVPAGPCAPPVVAGPGHPGLPAGPGHTKDRGLLDGVAPPGLNDVGRGHGGWLLSVVGPNERNRHLAPPT